MKSLGGSLLLLAWIFVIVNAYIPGVFRHLSAAVLWLSALFLFHYLSSTSRKQIFVLLLITLTLGVMVYACGGSIDWWRCFEINETMCTMFAAGSFLSLVSHESGSEETLHGRCGIFSTYCAANLLGGVINLASIYVIGDRLSRDGKLSKEQVELISRGFCAAAYWSPFFVGCAVAISLSNGMQLSITIPCGIVLSLITLAISYFEIVSRFRKSQIAINSAENCGENSVKPIATDLDSFEGYSLSLKDLKLPLALVVMVLLFHALDPERSILVIISIVIPAVVWFFKKSGKIGQLMHEQVQSNFPSMGGQIALYLAAGALSTVISALLDLGHMDFIHGVISSFGPFEALIVLMIIVAISFCGLHPIITIYTVIPIINQFHPEPSLVGLLIVVGWGLGITVSPLSAANLSFLGRYHTSGGMILRMNRSFIFKILIACYGVFWLETLLVR